jgi:hypothetical protein
VAPSGDDSSSFDTGRILGLALKGKPDPIRKFNVSDQVSCALFTAALNIGSACLFREWGMKERIVGGGIDARATTPRRKIRQ